MSRHNCENCTHKVVCALWEIQNELCDSKCAHYQPTLTPQNEWVSVEERFPEELKMVLVYCGGLYDVAGWVKDECGEVHWTCKTEPEFWRIIPELEV